MKPKTFKEYAIKIGGCVWNGDNVDDRCRFDTYEEAEAAMKDMEKQAEQFMEFNRIKNYRRCRYAIVERDITAWRKAKPKEDSNDRN